jgi:hypothetical protein
VTRLLARVELALTVLAAAPAGAELVPVSV